MSKPEEKIIKYGSVMELDHDKCIGCGNCVRVCKDQNVACLELRNEKGKKKSHPILNKPCIACGQSFSTNEEIKEKRSKALYQIDSQNKIRLAHQNLAVREILFNGSSGFSFSHPLFNTKYKNKSK